MVIQGPNVKYVKHETGGHVSGKIGYTDICKRKELEMKSREKNLSGPCKKF